jgi:hypothetical protein
MAPDAVGRAAERVRVQVSISRRGARLSMAEQLANDRQSEPGARADARVRVPQIVNGNAL